MKTASKAIVSILVALLLVILLGEFGTRAYVSNQIKEQFPVANEEVDVSFGTVPLLFGLVSGKADQLHATSPELNIEAEGIHLRGDNQGMMENVSVTTDISDEELVTMFQDAIRQEMPANTPAFISDNITVTDINSVQDGNIDVEFVHGASTLSLTPVIKDGGLTFEAASSTLFGVSLPDEVNANIEQAITEAMEEAAGADAMALRNVVVLDGGVRITVGGHNIKLEDLPQS